MPILMVGPSATYATPCAAFEKAADGDTIEIAAGTYSDVCRIAKNNLTIHGDVNAPVKIATNGTVFGDKAIWVVAGNDTTIENIEFSGAKSKDLNGAGIRQEGVNLTVRNCFFHDNEDGILAGDSKDSTIVIESTEFARNGAGDGYSHNLYINHVKSLVFRFNYSHDGKVGHLLKSRAATNVVSYNRLTDEKGNASYEIDLPNAGTSYIIGNVIEQAATTGNPNIVAYGEEGISSGYGSDLYVVNNTMVNHHTKGTFVLIGNDVATPAKLTNNIFFGPGTITSQGAAQQGTNFNAADPKFVDAANFDFHLAPDSPCVDKGSAPPSATTSLVPEFHYVHPQGHVGRKQAGEGLDIGAYELNGDVTEPTGAASSSSSSSGGPVGTSSGTFDPRDAGTDHLNQGDPSGAGEDEGCNTTGKSSWSGLGALLLAFILLAWGGRRGASGR